MISKELAQEIIKKVEDFTKKPVAILDLAGNVLSRTSNFTYNPEPNEIKVSKKATTITVDGEKTGYLYFDAKKEEITEEVTVIKSMIELLVHQRLILENISMEDRKINKFIYDLLHKTDYDESQAKAEAKIYGFNLSRPRTVIVFDVDGEIKKILHSDEIGSNEKEAYIGRIKKSISFSVNSFYTKNQKNITAYIGNSKFVVLKDLGTSKNTKAIHDEFLKTLNSLHYIIRSELRSDVSIGVSQYYKGISGLRESFEEAVMAVNFGEQVWGKNRIYHFDRFGVVAPLINSEQEIDFSRNMHESFANKEELIKTLEIFFENNMSLTGTAKKLKIHRNTLVYRLDKISEMLKLDPRVFDDAIQIKLSMIFGKILT